MSLPKKELKTLVLGNQTKIINGDIENILNFSKIEKVAFHKRNNYKYSGEEIASIISERKIKDCNYLD